MACLMRPRCILKKTGEAMQGFGKFVGIDLEWASAVPGNLCEIGVVWFEDGREVAAFKSLVRPIFPEWGSWQYLNLPYRLEDALEAPTFPEVWEELSPRLSGQIWIAHNAPSAESIYLGSALAHHGLHPPAGSELFCSLALARSTWPEAPAHGLRRMAARLNIPLDHHDPESDARACGAVVHAAAKARRLATLSALRDAAGWRSSPLKLVPPVLPEVPIRREAAQVFGVELTRWTTPVPFSGMAPGDRIVLSGLSESEKHRIRGEARSLGLRPSTTLNASTAFVVAGEFMGPAKYARCVSHGIPIIDASAWGRLYQGPR